MSATRIETTAYGVAALEKLRAVVAGLKADDPMKPVTLLLPNNLAGVVARRFLALTGIAGIYLATLPRLAEQLAAGVCSHRAARRPARSSQQPGVLRCRRRPESSRTSPTTRRRSKRLLQRIGSCATVSEPALERSPRRRFSGLT